jgi:hypothetical protein
LFLLLSIPIQAVWAQGKPFTITKGPYQWNTPIAEYWLIGAQVTVTVSSDPTNFPGLFLWHYTVQTGLPCWTGWSDPGPGGPVLPQIAFPRAGNGLRLGGATQKSQAGRRTIRPRDESPGGFLGLGTQYFYVIFPQDVPDIGTEQLDGVSYPDLAGPLQSPDGGVNAVYFAQECRGTSVVDFQFTTKPRQVVEEPACNAANGTPLSYLPGLPSLDDGFGHCGWFYALEVLDGGVPWWPGWWASTGPLAVPGGQVQLKSFTWDALAGDSAHGLQPMYETHLDDWTKDKMGPEGTTLVSEPGWRADDSGTVRSDPVSYTGGATAAVRAVKLTSDNQDPADAILRIESDQDSLKFTDMKVHFDGGKAKFKPTEAMISQNAFPGAVDNIDVNLTWSLSFDNGQTFVPFAWTEHQMFITLGPPKGYGGFGGIKAAPHVTAARLNWATNAAADGATPQGVVGDSIANVRGKILHVINRSIGIRVSPWHMLDNPPPGLDCISVTSVAVAVILQAGADVAESLAWPTSLDADASTQETLRLWERDTTLEYFLYDGSTLNWFEAFLVLLEEGDATEAYTAAPIAGPFPPWAGPTTLPLPGDPLKQLAFTVMYQTLVSERTPRQSGPPGRRAGEQWWIDNVSDKAVMRGPFPIPTQ